MSKYFLSIFLFLFCAMPALVSANTTGYAWSESVGWFDFSNVVVSDTDLSGYAYNDNTGWLSFEDDTTVTNSNGTLSGFAWSESVGWFDFSNVTISNGAFSGYAYNDNTGWLSFEDDTTVTTTWAPASPEPEPSSSRGRSGGSSVSSRINTLLKNGNTQEAQALQAKFPNAQTRPMSIEDLQATIRSLQAQIAQLLEAQGISTNTTFTRDLDLNATGQDVTTLQNLLIGEGFSIPAGATGFFGPQTQSALIQYQQANNIQPAVGYFGPLTRQSLTTN